MFATYLCFCLLLAKFCLCQLNGEFWWLNEKLNKAKGNKPPSVKIEEINELNDKDKIYFKDNNDDVEMYGTHVSNEESDTVNISFHDNGKFVWPANMESDNLVNNFTNNKLVKIDKSKLQAVKDDILEFRFPDDKVLLNNFNQSKNQKISIIKPVTNTIIFKEKEPSLEAQSICTYLKKSECVARKGFVYTYDNKYKNPLLENCLICCIMPLLAVPSKIHFKSSRYKRASQHDSSTISQNQRSFLLQQKNKIQNQRFNHRIVTSDEYVDPYLNIKNTKPTGTKIAYGGSDYEEPDYVEDYVVEFPKPGLTGIYSDYGQKPSVGWVFVNQDTEGIENYEEDEDDEESFGYSAVDPRLTATTRPKKLGRLMKLLTTSSEDVSFNSESKTIKYQANPDFKVLQGFKLLNLVSNKNRLHTKNERKKTESLVVGSPENNDNSGSDYSDSIDTNKPIFKECGKSLRQSLNHYGYDRQKGEAVNGSNPWLALVVLTKKIQNILCYATLVHPRFAVTAGDCIYGRSTAGEITLLAGLWDLDEDIVHSQQRILSTRLHSRFKPGQLENNLAVLFWKRPLRLSATVQPACLTDVAAGDNCKFVGWGGYDRAIHPRPRWQRAKILSPRKCEDRLSTSLPGDTLCATVDSQTTVTGIGGPLICEDGTRQAVAGIAVLRKRALVLLPAREWVLQIVDSLFSTL